MKRSEIRDCIAAHETPDYAALHPATFASLGTDPDRTLARWL